MSTTPEHATSDDADDLTAIDSDLLPGHADQGQADQGPADQGPAELDGEDGRRRRVLLWRLGVIAAAVLVIDQLAKAWAVVHLVPGARTPLLGDLLGLSLIHNPGAALSIGTGMTWVLTAVAITVAVVIVRVSRRIGSSGWAMALGLLLGGALGNLVDRLVRAPGPGRGEVVDFIAYGNVFIGNIADIAIVGAAAVVVLLSVRGIRVDGSREGGAAPSPDRADTTSDGRRLDGSTDA